MESQTAVVPFSFESHEIRTITDEFNNPWFIAKDVCDAIGIENVSMAL